MASVEDLRDALRDNLDRSGTLQQLKAKVRASIFKAISGAEVSRQQAGKGTAEVASITSASRSQLSVPPLALAHAICMHGFCAPSHAAQYHPSCPHVCDH